MRYVRFAALAAAAIVCFAALPFTANAAEEALSVGKPYTVEYATPIDNAYPNLAYEEETALTDGKLALSGYNDSNWVTLYRGTAARVTIDLGKAHAVSSVKVGQMQLKDYGVFCSRYLRVYLSDDGENFFRAGTSEFPEAITSSSRERVEFTCMLEKTYSARYVRAEFSSDVFTLVDEVTVLGSADTAGAEKIPAEYYSEPDNGFAGPVDGINSICLMYIASNYTEEMIKPYVAYIDEKGAVKDRMFDSLLFLGLTQTESSDGFMRMNDMKSFVESALGTGTGNNIAALDKVVGALKEELSLGADYKYPVFLSTPYVGVFSGSFGEINGANVSASDIESRNAIVDWYIDYAVNAFDEANFENLELKGLYWFKEGIEYKLSTDEEELIKHFTSAVREKGYKSIWIPYYSAAGIDKVPELGFDSVVMQSGYAFKGGSETGESLPGVVSDCAATAKKYGMGMEFEVDMNVSGYMDRFAQYVHVAYAEGLMNDGMMMMYQVGKNIYDSAVGSASIRPLYDLTYKYCSGTYTEIAPVIKSGATITVTAGEYVNGKVEIEDEDTPASKLKIVGLEKPEGVYFSVTGKGVYEVDTYKSQPGTYVARFAVSDGFLVSNTVEVTIIVEPAENSAAESRPESAAESAPESGSVSEQGVDNGGNMTIIIIAAAVLAAAGIAAALIIYFRKKRRMN